MNTFRTLLAVGCFLAAFAVAKSDVISNIQVNPTTVAAMQWNQDVTISFNYKASTVGGIRIFARPMSGGSLASSYAASGSPLYAVGSGVGTQSFTITSGSVVVDKIRFQVYNDNQSQLLLQFYVPVKFVFGSHQGLSYQHGINALLWQKGYIFMPEIAALSYQKQALASFLLPITPG